VTREQRILLNDTLRTQFRGGVVRYGSQAARLPAPIRGRAAIRLSRPMEFAANSEHDAGTFIFAGYLFEWHISECLGERTLTLEVAEDVLINGGTHAATR
jgi:hypothetical protein